MDNKIFIRPANENDVPSIFALIKELAEFEKLSDQINTSEDELRKTLFGENKFVEILLAEYDNKVVGQALFFKNFSSIISFANHSTKMRLLLKLNLVIGQEVLFA